MIVNATTCPALTRFLGITRAPEARNVLMRNVAQRARVHIMESLESLLTSAQASKACSPGLVKELVSHLMDVSGGDVHVDSQCQAWNSEDNMHVEDSVKKLITDNKRACGLLTPLDEANKSSCYEAT